MIIVTGGAGFIGNSLINSLFNYKEKLVICDYPELVVKKIFQKFS